MSLLSPPCSRKERAATERMFSWCCALCSSEYRTIKEYARTLMPVKAKIDPANAGRDGWHQPQHYYPTKRSYAATPKWRRPSRCSGAGWSQVGEPGLSLFQYGVIRRARTAAESSGRITGYPEVD